MTIDVERVRRVAGVVARYKDGFSVDDFTDETYYPPRGFDREVTVSYFVVMVALDHRLSRPGRPYEAVIDGRRFHGADLLYRLGALKLMEDPEFFMPHRLARLTLTDIVEWLCVDGVCPPDPERRWMLLRDLGVKALRLYGGFLDMLEAADGFIRGEPGRPGLVDLLRVFDAYGDPVEKKSMLLAKFLERRGLFSVRDVWNKRVPVDNHVTRIALRLGIVRVGGRLWEKLAGGVGFEWWEDVLLRMAVREAWFMVSVEAGIDPFILDDFLWSMGRRVCLYGSPRCTACRGHDACRGGSCIFLPVCRRLRGPGGFVNEHFFVDTWWY